MDIFSDEFIHEVVTRYAELESVEEIAESSDVQIDEICRILRENEAELQEACNAADAKRISPSGKKETPDGIERALNRIAAALEKIANRR